MTTEYKNYGQAGAIGENARSDNNQFAQVTPISTIDLVELATQLAQVRTEMRKQADPSVVDHDEAIGIIASAEKAAKAGNESKALEYLKGAGKWTLEIAKSVAASLVKDAIEGKI